MSKLVSCVPLYIIFIDLKLCFEPSFTSFFFVARHYPSHCETIISDERFSLSSSLKCNGKRVIRTCLLFANSAVHVRRLRQFRDASHSNTPVRSLPLFSLSLVSRVFLRLLLLHFLCLFVE